MKSRTSFCKPILVKKDITRFAPVWVLYTVWALLILLSFLSFGSGSSHIMSLASYIQIFAAVDLVYAFLTAQVLFGDLFRSRLCNALHAMPVSRTHQFWSHVTAGVLFSLLPNVAVTVALMCKLGSLWYTALLWLLGVSLAYVYFFGLAVLCMMLTGNRFACTAVYAIINFFAYVVWWFLHSVFMPLMPGVVLGGGDFSLFCPVVLMVSGDLFDYKYANSNSDIPRQVVGVALESGWITFAVFGLVGIGLLILALVLYRRRALEKAGDFLAVKALEPVFLVLYTLCAGAFLALCAFEDELLPAFLTFGILIGYFTGRMLLERTVRVLHRRAFRGIAVLALVMAVALGLVKLDVFGIVRYVPGEEAVQYAQVYTYYPQQSCATSVTFTDPEDLALVETAHRTALEHLEDDDSAHFVTLNICYTLKNGRTVNRSYRVYSTAVEDSVKVLCQRPQAVLGFSDPEEAASVIRECHVTKGHSALSASMRTPSNKQGLLEALVADCLAGNNTVVSDKDDAAYIVGYDLLDHDLYISREAEHTVAWLDAYFKNLHR